MSTLLRQTKNGNVSDFIRKQRAVLNLYRALYAGLDSYILYGAYNYKYTAYYCNFC